MVYLLKMGGFSMAMLNKQMVIFKYVYNNYTPIYTVMYL